MQKVLDFAARRAEKGQRVALVSVTATTGSSPAHPGQMIAVVESGETCGTVGGGSSEYKIIQLAIEAIKKGQRVFQFSFDHAESGMTCGGAMEGFGNVLGQGAVLLLFGGGHIAQSLASLAAATGFFVKVVEDRPEFAHHFPTAQYIVCTPQEYERTLAIQGDTYAVICTRGHATDDEALAFCLTKQLCYLGMIGSKQKVKGLFDKLEKQGLPQQTLQSIYAPIGLDIASASPPEIAVAILSEILLVKNKGTLRHKKDSIHE